MTGDRGIPASGARAAELFTARFASPPHQVWSAPGRVNLIGEHTDYNDGFVLPYAIGRRTAVAVAPDRSPLWTVISEEFDETVVLSADHLTPGAVPGWAAYVAGVLWALREAGMPAGPARIAIASDVPLGAGLSSSAALTCALLAAMLDLGGSDVPRDRWPRLAHHAESSYVGVPCGIMDQTAAVLARRGHALFLDCRHGTTRHIPLPLDADGLALLVVDTRVPHRHTTGAYADRRAACESAARTLDIPALRDLTPDGLPAARTRLDPVTGRRVRHVVTENQRVLDAVHLLEAGQLRDIGALLTGSHTSMRDDFEVTVPETDLAVETMLAAGARGARMTGGGFGGCVLALVEKETAGRVAAAVVAAFTRAGYARPDWFVADTDGGARPALPGAG